jgi:glycosyltransferase involved in cell wall biosynthesis
VYKRHARYDLAAVTAARRAGIPSVLEVNTVFTAPEYERFEPLRLLRMATAVERRAIQSATVVIAVSTPLARQAANLSGRTVLTVPNGADPQWFDPRLANGARVRARYGWQNVPVVGWTGILRDWHGVELLLEALTTLPAVVLLIVGDGPARPMLEKRVSDLGLDARVVITGRVRHEEVRDYIAAMDIAVVAHERTGVASPMKLLEYMAMERAIVAPRAENISDVVDDGVDGTLFDPGSSRDLASRIRELAVDERRREALGRAARRKVESERNWDRIAELVLGEIGRAHLARAGDDRC